MIPAAEHYHEAIRHINAGGIIAHPTESVYGFACDPFNVEAITRLLQIKQRSYQKGFILVAHRWELLEDLVQPIAPMLLANVLTSWPGPVTWVFPAQPDLPEWIQGDQKTVAVRVTAHPIASELCRRYNKPLISTSCNRAGQYPSADFRTTQITFGKEVDFILPGHAGESTKPTPIIDAVSGDVLRE